MGSIAANYHNRRCPNCGAHYRFPAITDADGVTRNGADPNRLGIFLCTCFCFLILVAPGSKRIKMILR